MFYRDNAVGESIRWNISNKDLEFCVDSCTTCTHVIALEYDGARRGIYREINTKIGW